MSLEPLQFRGVECTVCQRRFDGMDDFKNHHGRDDRPCPGGTPA